jgi:hypothetical protein
VGTPRIGHDDRLDLVILGMLFHRCLLSALTLYHFVGADGMDLNPRPELYKSPALPLSYAGMVDAGVFEPPACRASTGRSTV